MWIAIAWQRISPEVTGKCFKCWISIAMFRKMKAMTKDGDSDTDW